MSRVQYGIWPNCCNACDFCLNLREAFYSVEEQKNMIKNVRHNIKLLDWKNVYYHGISLLGGELYFIQDEELQEEFLKLIDDIIEYVVRKENGNFCKYSTVTNGLYDPTFLFKVLDKFREKDLMNAVDLNFSYDLKYRFKTEERKKLCETNIVKTVERYPELKVNVQMILTQHLINEYRKNNNILKEIEEKLHVDSINLLFPHKHNTGKPLEDFYLKRSDFLWFLYNLNEQNHNKVKQFVESILNVDDNALIGLYRRNKIEENNINIDQLPMKEDNKTVINPSCGHSTLYQCYEDSDRCLFCDIRKFQC